jgi:hypothetical protein
MSIARTVFAMFVAAAAAPATATTLDVCIRPNGDMKALDPGETCRGRQVLVSLMVGPAASPTVEYHTGLMVPGTSVARAFCPPGTKVVGGGGFSHSGAGLQQSHPISDNTGVIAFGTTAIGWQVAADDWSTVQAHVACMR